ncbi:oxidation resistance protein 1 [Coemansia sp. RSA 1933]|nr:oxidation resistance protein 1 [Coemansia sp. RSA 1933]
MNLHKFATHSGASANAPGQSASLDSPPSLQHRTSSLDSSSSLQSSRNSSATATASGNSSHESLLASQHSVMPPTSHRSISEVENATTCTGSLMDVEAANTTAHNNSAKSMPTPRSARPPIQLLGRKDDTPKVLSPTIANKLRPLLPVQQRLAKSWRLVYSIDQHGISIHTMLDLCAHEKSVLLAIKDTKGKVFGAYLNEPIRLSPSFYGQGTCFLWKAFRASPESRRKDAVKSFKYTGGNEYFILCDPDFVAIGGGRGKFGLWFKSDFLHGYSARCPTFNNEPLCLDPSSPKNADVDAQQEFVVGHLEIWAFDS